MIKLQMALPTLEVELEILRRHEAGAAHHNLEQIEKVTSAEEIKEIQKVLARVTCSDDIKVKIIEAIADLRPGPSNAELGKFSAGPSTRASIAVMKLAKFEALRQGRAMVQACDVAKVFPYVVSHRMLMKLEHLTDREPQKVIEELVGKASSRYFGE